MDRDITPKNNPKDWRSVWAYRIGMIVWILLSLWWRMENKGNIIPFMPTIQISGYGNYVFFFWIATIALTIADTILSTLFRSGKTSLSTMADISLFWLPFFQTFFTGGTQ